MSDFFEIKEQTEKKIGLHNPDVLEFLEKKNLELLLRPSVLLSLLPQLTEEERRWVNPNFYTKKDSCI